MEERLVGGKKVWFGVRHEMNAANSYPRHHLKRIVSLLKEIDFHAKSGETLPIMNISLA